MTLYNNTIISFYGLIFTTQPYISNNNNRYIENIITEYEKSILINFTKEQFSLNSNSNNSISTYNMKLNNKPLNTPIFKKHLGIFITIYKYNDTTKNYDLRGCRGTSETNNDDYTIETNIKKFVLELSTNETKCRDIIFQPLHKNELNKLKININILYHMKELALEDYHKQFKFGCDGLLIKSTINNTPFCKYSLTHITEYFNNYYDKEYNIKNNNKITLLNELINKNTINSKFKLFYNEGLLI